MWSRWPGGGGWTIRRSPRRRGGRAAMAAARTARPVRDSSSWWLISAMSNTANTMPNADGDQGEPAPVAQPQPDRQARATRRQLRRPRRRLDVDPEHPLVLATCFARPSTVCRASGRLGGLVVPALGLGLGCWSVSSCPDASTAWSCSVVSLWVSLSVVTPTTNRPAATTNRAAAARRSGRFTVRRRVNSTGTCSGSTRAGAVRCGGVARR